MKDKIGAMDSLRLDSLIPSRLGSHYPSLKRVSLNMNALLSEQLKFIRDVYKLDNYNILNSAISLIDISGSFPIISKASPEFQASLKSSSPPEVEDTL